MLSLITHDVHNIAKRLKKINSKYVLFRNHAANRVEVHSNARPCALSLEFIVPFDELNERTLEYARKTRIENFDAIEAEQIKANAEIQRTAQVQAQKATAILGDMMKYASNQVHEVIFKSNKKWF